MVASKPKPGASSDAALVRAVQDGDPQAYNLLVVRYQHRVLQVARRYTDNEQDAADVAQESFIRAYRSLGGFRGESAFYTWLYCITVNVAKNWLEQNRNRRNFLDIDDDALAQDGGGEWVTHDSPEGILQSEELRVTIARAVEELPAELRQALLLREVEGRSYEEIAAVTGAPVGTVRSRIFRARQYVDEQMSKS